MNPNTGSDARQSDAQGPGQAPQLGVIGDVDKWAEARGGFSLTLSPTLSLTPPLGFSNPEPNINPN